MGSWDGAFENDLCRPIPIQETWLPPSMNPPADWRGKFLDLYLGITQDGGIDDVKVLVASGVEALDAAAVAQVKRSWRFVPLACGRTHTNSNLRVRVPRQTCTATGFTPPIPLSLAQVNRNVSASVDLVIGEDGSMQDSKIADGSGDAALDAALLTHIRQNWHYWPQAAGCGVDKKHVLVRFPQSGCIPTPVLESRTVPDAAPQTRARAVDLQVGLDPEGKVLFTNVIRSSGDTALDAAAQTHVKAAWRWQPMACERKVVYALGRALPVIDFARVTVPARGGV